MNLLLDGELLGASGMAAGATVGEALESAKSRLSGTGSLIFAVRCDGSEVSPETLEEVLSRRTDEFGEVEFISGRPAEVVVAALAQTRAALGETPATAREAAHALSRGRVSEAMASLVRCLAVWGQVHESVVQGGGLCRVDFEALVIDGRSMLDHLHELTRQLRGLRSAIESGDHVLLGDMLQYEMEGMIRGWDRILDGIINHLSGAAAG